MSATKDDDDDSGAMASPVLCPLVARTITYNTEEGNVRLSLHASLNYKNNFGWGSNSEVDRHIDRFYRGPHDMKIEPLTRLLADLARIKTEDGLGFFDILKLEDVVRARKNKLYVDRNYQDFIIELLRVQFPDAYTTILILANSQAAADDREGGGRSKNPAAAAASRGKAKAAPVRDLKAELEETNRRREANRKAKAEAGGASKSTPKVEPEAYKIPTSRTALVEDEPVSTATTQRVALVEDEPVSTGKGRYAFGESTEKKGTDKTPSREYRRAAERAGLASPVASSSSSAAAAAAAADYEPVKTKTRPSTRGRAEPLDAEMLAMFKAMGIEPPGHVRIEKADASSSASAADARAAPPAKSSTQLPLPPLPARPPGLAPTPRQPVIADPSVVDAQLASTRKLVQDLQAELSSVKQQLVEKTREAGAAVSKASNLERTAAQVTRDAKAFEADANRTLEQSREYTMKLQRDLLAFEASRQQAVEAFKSQRDKFNSLIDKEKDVTEATRTQFKLAREYVDNANERNTVLQERMRRMADVDGMNRRLFLGVVDDLINVLRTNGVVPENRLARWRSDYLQSRQWTPPTYAQESPMAADNPVGREEE